MAFGLPESLSSSTNYKLIIPGIALELRPAPARVNEDKTWLISIAKVKNLTAEICASGSSGKVCAGKSKRLQSAVKL